MDLERKQALHNGIISSAGNTSASLDPLQIPNDANDVLAKGAMAASAGRTLGLSEEETLSAVSRQFRRQQQRSAYKNRNERQAKWEQSQKTLQAEGFQIESPDTDTIDPDNLTEEERVFGITDIEGGFREDPDGDESDFEFESRGTRKYKDGREEPIINPVRPEERPKFYPEISPKTPLKDALDLLRSGTSQFGYSALPGAADAEGRIEQSIGGYVDPSGEVIQPIERICSVLLPLR